MRSTATTGCVNRIGRPLDAYRPKGERIENQAPVTA
jgi:hypothetical protein